MLTNRIIYCTLVILAAFMRFYYGGTFSSALVTAALVAPALSYLYTRLVLARFKYVQEFSQQYIVKNDTVHLRITVVNEDFFFHPWLRINFIGDSAVFEEDFRSQSLSLLPGERVNFDFDLSFRYRGKYAVGIDSVEASDLLGLFVLRWRLRERKEITINPNLVRLSYFPLNTDAVSDPSRRDAARTEDMTSVTEARGYLPGDSTKRIHWKLTARMGKLMSKVYESASEMSATVLLDLRPAAQDKMLCAALEDVIVEAAVAVSLYCLRRGVPVELLYLENGAVKSETERSMYGFDRLYGILGGITFRESVGADELISLHLLSGAPVGNLIVLTSILGDGLTDELCRASAFGHRVTLVYASETPLDADKERAGLRETLPDMGVAVCNPLTDGDIRAALEGGGGL